jgi:hypothetical protein
MKNLLFGFVVLVSAGLCLVSCSDDDVDLALCHEWHMIGYGNDQDFHVGDGRHDEINARITFYSDGTYKSFANQNDGYGSYKCKGGQIAFEDYEYTKKASDNPVDWFVEEKLFLHYTYLNYMVTETELRIYYEGDHYFKFYRKD